MRKLTAENAKTKLAKILVQQKLTQNDLYYLIQSVTGKTVGLDRISKMVNGKLNYTVETAKLVSRTLNITLDELID
jgi:hypothetical protein